MGLKDIISFLDKIDKKIDKYTNNQQHTPVDTPRYGTNLQYGTTRQYTQPMPAPVVPEQPDYRSENNYDARRFESTAYESDVITFEERKKTSYPSKRGLYVAEILLLDYCAQGKYPNPKDGYPGLWWYEYGVKDVGAILKSLEDRGFICYAPVYETLKGLTTVQLKSIAAAHNLTVSGNKSELINRIINNVPENILLNTGVERKYTLTELGKQELNDNGYVPFMHKCKSKTSEDSTFNDQYTIWSINRLIHGHPGEHWDDVMRDDFNLQIESQKLKLPREHGTTCYHKLIYTYYRMAELCYETQRYKEAFSWLALNLYYEFVIIAPMEYPTSRESEFSKLCIAAPFIINALKANIKKLRWTEEETVRELRRVCTTVNSNSIFSTEDYIALVLANIHNDREQIRWICSNAMNK